MMPSSGERRVRWLFFKVTRISSLILKEQATRKNSRKRLSEAGCRGRKQQSSSALSYQPNDSIKKRKHETGMVHRGTSLPWKHGVRGRECGGALLSHSEHGKFGSRRVICPQQRLHLGQPHPKG